MLAWLALATGAILMAFGGPLLVVMLVVELSAQEPLPPEGGKFLPAITVV